MKECPIATTATITATTTTATATIVCITMQECHENEKLDCFLIEIQKGK